MWAVYIDAVRTHLPQATIVFDRFHLSQHLSRAVDDVRRQTWRHMAGREKAEFKRTRVLWLTNPPTPPRQERTRPSAPHTPPREKQQQGQVHQPCRLCLWGRLALDRQHLPLLCGPAAALTLLGEEP